MLRRAGIGLALRAPRLGPCTPPRTGRFRWPMGIAHGPSAVEGSQKVRTASSFCCNWLDELFAPNPSTPAAPCAAHRVFAPGGASPFGHRPASGTPHRGVSDQGLGVVTREVVDAADGWPAAEGGMGSVMVVPMDPGLQGTVAGGVGAVQPPIGPLLQQGPVEPLYLAVRLWSVGTSALVAHAGVGQRRREQPAAVADPVV